jgi:hypothetical protein
MAASWPWMICTRSSQHDTLLGLDAPYGLHRYHSPSVTVQRQKDNHPDTPEVLTRLEDRCYVRKHGP